MNSTEELARRIRDILGPRNDDGEALLTLIDQLCLQLDVADRAKKEEEEALRAGEVPCPECGSKDSTWHCLLQPTNGAPADGRLRGHEIRVVFYRGCNYCSETLGTMTEEEVTCRLSRPYVSSPPVITATFESETRAVTGTMRAPVKRVEREDDGSFDVVLDYWPGEDRAARDNAVQQAQIWAQEARTLKSIINEIGEMVGCTYDYEVAAAVKAALGAAGGNGQELASGAVEQGDDYISVPSIGEQAQAAPRQYFYRNFDCPALTSAEPTCICWHDEGTGPLRERPEDLRIWRQKPEREDE